MKGKVFSIAKCTKHVYIFSPCEGHNRRKTTSSWCYENHKFKTSTYGLVLTYEETQWNLQAYNSTCKESLVKMQNYKTHKLTYKKLQRNL
jgi:hypothetical protein